MRTIVDSKTNEVTVDRDYVAPATPDRDQDPYQHKLKRWQFHAMIEMMGKTDAITAALDAISDPVAKAVAKSKFNHVEHFYRDDPLFAQLAPAVGMSDEDIDAAWLVAKDL